MTTSLRRACVMGYPVAQSRSPMIHNHWLAELGIPGLYELKELTPEAFPEFVTNLEANGYVGGNVTVPHKQAAFRLVQARDAAAEATADCTAATPMRTASSAIWTTRSRAGMPGQDAR